jgi:hypothetical protein
MSEITQQDLLVVLFRAPVEGTKWLRALPAAATDTDYVNTAVALGAVSWTTLGEVSLPVGGTVVEHDYVGGVSVARRARTRVS